VKPIPRSNFSKIYTGVRIYRDDLHRIFGLMQKANMEITITDETFEYESLDDLQKAAGNTPRGITIEGRDASFRRVALSMFEQYRWHLRSSPDENPYQLARDIDEILQARRTAIKNPTIICDTRKG
jgi:hypothetical protein